MASVLIESLSNLLQVIYVVQCSHELKKNWCIIIFFSQATNLEIIYALRRFVCGEKIYLQSNFRMKKFSNIFFFKCTCRPILRDIILQGLSSMLSMKCSALANHIEHAVTINLECIINFMWSTCFYNNFDFKK